MSKSENLTSRGFCPGKSRDISEVNTEGNAII
jgi:hypothetical protein